MIHVPALDLDRPVVLLIVLALSLIDGVFPLLPARTVIIALGVVAKTGDFRAYPLLVAASAGAFISDNVSYWLGSRYGERIIGTITAGGRRRQRVRAWAEHTIRVRGLPLIVLARVIPGGPTPITLIAGISHYPISRFRIATAVGACLWSVYAFAVGLAGGTIVSDNPLVALLVALGIAAVLNLALTVGMHHKDMHYKDMHWPNPFKRVRRRGG